MQFPVQSYSFFMKKCKKAEFKHENINNSAKVLCVNEWQWLSLMNIQCHCEEGVRRGGRLTKQSKILILTVIDKILDRHVVRRGGLLAMTSFSNCTTTQCINI